MAEESEEYFHLLEDVDINQLLVLQAYIRGSLTRRWLKELRLEYQHISGEIERKDLNIEWPSDQPCLPKILSRRQKKTPKHSEKVKDSKLSVEIQPNFNTPEATGHQLNSVRAQGTGTVSDPVVINDSVLDVSNQTDPIKQGELDALDSIPVRDSDSSEGQVMPQENSDHALEGRNERGDLHATLLSGHTQMPNYAGTTVKEIPRSDNSVQVCDVTSVWDAELSSFATEEIRLPAEKSELKDLRKNLSMELLWIQQAIQSRKNVSMLPRPGASAADRVILDQLDIYLYPVLTTKKSDGIMKTCRKVLIQKEILEMGTVKEYNWVIVIDIIVFSPITISKFPMSRQHN